LLSEIPHAQVRLSRETGVAEMVAPGRAHRVLTAPSALPRERIARDFITRHAALFGLQARQVDALHTDADYLNPAGNLAWVRLVHALDGVPVFRSEVSIAMTPAGEIVRAVGQLAPGPDFLDALQQPTHGAVQAVERAAAAIGIALQPGMLRVGEAAVDGRQVAVLGSAFDPDR